MLDNIPLRSREHESCNESEKNEIATPRLSGWGPRRGSRYR